MINLYNVSFSYPTGEGVKGVNLQITPGEFVYLIGPSGAGKSTLLKLIYMDVFPQSGHIVVNGYNSLKFKKRYIPYLRRKIGIIFQDFKLLNDRSVFENITFVLQVTGTKRGDIKKRALKVLAEVGLSHKRNKMPQQLSGGEQQRVAIARALVNEPIILLADEPTGNLDPVAANDILNILDKINVKGTAILMATHSDKLVQGTRKRIVNIMNGKLIS
ncbi:cell division ATP-binding protein FtsE [candidate division KSB1 bacterium]|nr:cell division ATP-binding protein FtsE [candidate division KSB1 bacterium]